MNIYFMSSVLVQNFKFRFLNFSKNIPKAPEFYCETHTRPETIVKLY